MSITLRNETGSALSYRQVDTNFCSYYYSSSLSGSQLTLYKTGSRELGIPVISSSYSFPFQSKWTDIPNGIQRVGNVQVSGAFNQSNNGSATGTGSHVEGIGTTATGVFSHAEGIQTVATGYGSHAEGRQVISSGTGSHAEGYSTATIGSYSHAEGNGSTSFGLYSHAEGSSTISSGSYSHAEGGSTITTGIMAHAEGTTTIAEGNASHAEGGGSKSVGQGSHAEGYYTTSSGIYSHAEGSQTKALGESSHTEGLGTIAIGDFQHVQGQYNLTSSASSAWILGNGQTEGTRSNLIFASGSTVEISGSLKISGSFNSDSVIAKSITAEQYIVSTSVYYVTESYSSGSHQFGNSTDDIHTFTGSILQTGNLSTEGHVEINGQLRVYSTSSPISFWRNQNKLDFTIGNGDVPRPITIDSDNQYSLDLSSAGELNFRTGVGRGNRLGISGSGQITVNPENSLTGSTALVISGSVDIKSGSSFIYGGNKQFNYGSFYHTASISVNNGSSGSCVFSTTRIGTGVNIVSGSRITIFNPGVYDIQFLAQVAQGSGASNVALWVSKNGTNIPSSTTYSTQAGNNKNVITVNTLQSVTSPGDYFEILHQSDASNTTLEYTSASGNIPSSPSITVTVSQVG